MEQLLALITNPYVIAALCSWFISQVTKGITYAIVHKKFSLKRMLGDGGMPSGHSATIFSVAGMAAWTEGFGSFAFAVSVILAIIVCRDAIGVRLETERQSKLLNDLRAGASTEELRQMKFKEHVGHTTQEVVAGAVVGIVVSTLLFFLVFA